MQVYDESFAEDFDFDVLDPTPLPRSWSRCRSSVVLTLDRVVDNDFADSQFLPHGNLPPGVDFSNDPLLQGRNFSYLDTQLSRLGTPTSPSCRSTPLRCRWARFPRDAKMPTRSPQAEFDYEPNGFAGGRTRPRRMRQRVSSAIEGPGQQAKVRVLRPATFTTTTARPGRLFISQTAHEQDHIVKAYAFRAEQCKVPQVRSRMLAHLLNVHEDLRRPASPLALVCRLRAAASQPTRTDLPLRTRRRLLEKDQDSSRARSKPAPPMAPMPPAQGARRRARRGGAVLRDHCPRRRWGDPERWPSPCRPDDRRRPPVLYTQSSCSPASRPFADLAGARCRQGLRLGRLSRTTSPSGQRRSRPLLEAAEVASLIQAASRSPGQPPQLREEV